MTQGFITSTTSAVFLEIQEKQHFPFVPFETASVQYRKISTGGNVSLWHLFYSCPFSHLRLLVFNKALPAQFWVIQNASKSTSHPPTVRLCHSVRQKCLKMCSCLSLLYFTHLQQVKNASGNKRSI